MRVRNHLRIVHQYKLLDQLAYLDGLTEISNRRRFEEVFQKEWARAIRSGLPFSLAMVDVDYFKQYNDHYGHAMGDLTLQKIAKALAGVLRRPADFIARYGGEEFVMLLPETDAPSARKVVERARQDVIEQNIVHNFSNAARVVSVSVGLATIYAGNRISPQTFLETADQNLYQAKQRGRNQVVYSLANR
jgi:diguanylate cyclase (GGDEF)-like protein